MAKCDICGKTYKGEHGVGVHKSRTPACGGKNISWGTSRKSVTRGRNGESGQEAINQILAAHPEGLTTKKIYAELDGMGLKLNANYVSQMAARDPNLIKVGRGIYRLKANRRSSPVRSSHSVDIRQSGTAIVQEAVAEATEVANLPSRDALLVRIETLETQNRALQDAHIALLRGAIA